VRILEAQKSKPAYRKAGATLVDLRMFDPNDRSSNPRLLFRPEKLRELGIPDALIDAAAKSGPQGFLLFDDLPDRTQPASGGGAHQVRQERRNCLSRGFVSASAGTRGLVGETAFVERSEFEGAEGDLLRSDVERAAEGEVGGSALEGLFGGNAGKIGSVVLFGEMREDEVARPGVENLGIGEEFADDRIGKMSGAAHDALLDVPGIRADLEHFEIVIGFEDEEIGVAEMYFDELGKIAEIGDDGNFGVATAAGVADGISGVMGNRERRDFNIADGEAQARTDVLDASGMFRGCVGEHLDDFAVRWLGEVGGTIPLASHLGKAAGVVGMLVSDEDGVDMFGACAAEGFEAAKHFLAAEASVNKEGGEAGLEQRRVARTAGSENRNAERDAVISRSREE